MKVNERIKEQRKKMRYTQKELADKVCVSSQVISNWERGYTEPSADDVNKLAEILNCSTDYLLGRTTEPTPGHKQSVSELSPKEEKDILKDLQKILEGLEGGYAAYDGKTPEEIEDQELLKTSLETSMRLAKRLAKEKFTPNKHKK